MKRTPLTPSLSPSGGEGVRRTGEGEPRRFMVPMHDRIDVPSPRAGASKLVQGAGRGIKGEGS